MARRAVLVVTALVAAVGLAACEPAPGPPPGTPFGAFDQIWQGGSTPTVWASGWAIDPDTTEPIDVHVYVDGVLNHTMGASSLPRPDVAAAYPGYGEAHGFNLPLRTVGGPQEVCAYAVNAAGPGVNALLGCRRIAVHNPMGSVDVDASHPAGLRLRGWARDLDAADAVPVTIAVRGREPVRVLADRPLAVRNGTMPFAAEGRGFEVVIPAPFGTYDIEVTAGSLGPGGDSELSDSTWDRRPGVPVGELERYDTSVAGQFRVTGWAFDPDSPDPIDVEVSVQGARTVVRADRPRPEVAAFVGRPSAAVGFDATVPTPGGHVRVCVIAKDTAAERDDNWLACQDFIR